MKQTFKRIPFDIELAKKITKGEKKGRILTQEGKKVRIVCWDKKPISKDALDFPIVAIIENDCNGEMLHIYTKEGNACYPNYKSRYNLIIEIPIYQKDYSKFIPQKWQACVVRDVSCDIWVTRICCGKDYNGEPTFFTSESSDSYCHQNYILPLNNITKNLIDTNQSYEELIKELANKF